MTHFKLLVLVGSLSFAQTLFAVPKDYSIEKPNVNFVAVGKPAMLKIKGKSEDLKGKITIDVDKLNANLILNLNALVTGIDTRDNHMKEKYLEVPKFPNAELTIAFQKKKPAFTNLIRLIYYFNLEFISISANSLARLTHSVIN